MFLSIRTVCLALMVAAWFGETGLSQKASAERECYELRIYRIFDFEKQQEMLDHLQNGYLPALGRLGIDRVGVFTNMKDENDHSIFVLIPFASAQAFTDLRDNLLKDSEYQAAEIAFSQRPLKEPVFDRVESRFMRSFAGIPKMELADFHREKKPRLFELRLYQSHTDDHARRKVKMFNDGEIQLMRDVEMAPVFFGETLIGPDVPNLIYLLSAENEDDHKAHWQAFLADPRWDEMKGLPEYADTVSRIRNWFLTPTSFSGF